MKEDLKAYMYCTAFFVVLVSVSTGLAELMYYTLG